MDSKLKPYMAYSRWAGSAKGAMLVIAHNTRDAKKIAWPALRDWGLDEYTDMAVRLLRDDSRRFIDSHIMFALADQAKLVAGEPHVVVCPQVCDTCKFWGYGVDADGYCEGCGGYAGDLLVKLRRDYEARQMVVAYEDKEVMPNTK